MKLKKVIRAGFKYIFDSEYRFLNDANRGKYNNLDDETFIKRKFRAEMGYDIDLEHPKTFNEKLNWLKLYDRNPEYSRLVDKFAVKKYVAERIGEKYVIPLIGGPWYSFDEIPLDTLPQQFVLKTSHDCGGVYLCKDKSSFDADKARKFLTSHLNRDYYLTGREWPYKNVKPCIFAEEYMSDVGDSDQLTDYKFFCFDGQVKALFVATDRQRKNAETKFDFFDVNFSHLPIVQGHPNADRQIECPPTFEKMKELASELSRGFPELRVDFYNVGNQIYFGELTLFHFSGFVPFVPSQWDLKFGEWINLPDKKLSDTSASDKK